MPYTKLEACFFVDEPPEIEYRNGLIHVTQTVGGYRFERVMRPNVFLKAIRAAQRVAKAFAENPNANILAFQKRIPRAVDEGH